MKISSKDKTLGATAQMLVYAQDGTEMIFPCPSELLHVGDLVLLVEGYYIPADTKILTGTIAVQDANGDEQTYEPKSIAPQGRLITKGRAKGYVFQELTVDKGE